MERVVLPSFKPVDAGSHLMSAKMDKIFNTELASTVYQLSRPHHPPKSILKTNQNFPLRPAERDRIARTMNVEDVMNTTQYYEDETQKGQRRWKEIRHLFLVTRKVEHSRGSLENALWYYGHNGITCNHFVHAIMDEFNFRPEVDDMEAHLRWLYWSFNGGTADKADWREILATFRIPIFYRMVQTRPVDLLLAIFDIYAIGGTEAHTSTKHPNEAWFITDVTTTLRTIFCLACETAFDIEQMSELVDKAILSNFEHLKKGAKGMTKEQRIQEGIKQKAEEEAKVVEEAIAKGMNVEEAKTQLKRSQRKAKRAEQKEDAASKSAEKRGSGDGDAGSEENKTGKERLLEIQAASKSSADDSHYAIESALRNYDIKMYRKHFRQFMRTHQDTLVVKFQAYCWARLPVDLRLASLDEQQVIALKTSDNIMYRFKLEQALHIYKKSLYRSTFKDWYAAAQSLSVVRRHSQRRYKYRKVQFFNFWRKLASTRAVKTKRRILADVMGAYSCKARAFYRIKLFNFQTGYIMRTVGTFNKHAKSQKAAFSHLREYVRINWLRKRYHQWWNRCVQEHNWELAMDNDWERLLRNRFRRWGKWAIGEARQKRMENMAIENKMDFDKKMREAERDALVLIDIEKAKIEKEKAIADAAAEVAKQERLEKARIQALKNKKEEKNIILMSQKETRRRRVRKDMAKFKKKFAQKWVKQREEYITKAKMRIDAYIKDDYNKLAIEMKFEKLKREFFAPPSRENRAREIVLTSHKNIVFLFLDAKLRNDNLTMEKVLYKWDEHKRGYLTYDEFKALVKALGVKLNPSQLSQVIRGVDADGDGCIELKELLDSMKDIELMGVVGSPWKMYVDAAQDVIVYHNFLTEQKVFEYNMTDEILMEVTHSNIYGAADEDARVLADKAQEEDWEFEITSFMARRMQYMYRYWKSKKTRRQWLWKLKTRESNHKNAKAFFISAWIIRHLYGRRSREKFQKELFLTYEKVFMADTGQMFWFNHLLKTSLWERPHLLWRYGDVKLPVEWIPIDVPTVSAEEMEADPGREQLYALHYWHVKAKRDIPRKPDGLPICHVCYRNLATDHCDQCAIDYCFPCLREMHSSPFEFKQKAVLKIEDRQNTRILEKLKNSLSHTFSPVSYPSCGMCRTEKVLAGMFCKTCNKDKGGMAMCRPCCRRIHEKLPEHETHAI